MRLGSGIAGKAQQRNGNQNSQSVVHLGKMSTICAAKARSNEHFLRVRFQFGNLGKENKLTIHLRTLSIWCALWFWLIQPVSAQQQPDRSGQAVDPQIVDLQIKAALNEISAGQIQSDIEKLVSFQTRSTISSQDAASISAGRGIGAAREWIKAEFERYSRDCGGCLGGKTDSVRQ